MLEGLNELALKSPGETPIAHFSSNMHNLYSLENGKIGRFV